MKRPELPLAAAAARLRGKPGRPRKHPQSGHIPGTAGPQGGVNAGPEGRALAYGAIAPRLLDLKLLGAYLGLSYWSARDLVMGGALAEARVRVPLPGGKEIRRVLVDRERVDQIVATWREGA